jgi:hypothetical protein
MNNFQEEALRQVGMLASSYSTAQYLYLYQERPKVSSPKHNKFYST